MIAGPGSWLLGTAASVALHGVGALAVLYLVAPEDMPDQPTPTAQFELETTALERSRAEERQPEGQEAEDVAPEGTVAQGQGIVRRDAPAAPPPSATAAALEERAPPATAVAAPADRAEARTPEAGAVQGATPDAADVTASAPQGASAPAVAAESTPTASQTIAAEAAPPALAPTNRVDAREAPSGPVQAAFQPPERVASASAPPAATVRAEAPSAPLQAAFVPPERQAVSAAPPAPSVRAEAPVAPVQAAFQPPERQAAAAPPPSPVAPAERPTGAVAPPQQATGAVAPQQQAEGQRAAAQQAEAAPAATAPTEGAPAEAAPTQGASAAAAPTEGAPAAAAPTEGAPAATAAVEGTPAPARVAEGPVIGAELAWAGQGALDPQGLAAVQAFLPEAARGKEGEEVRDDISALMSSVPCARVHTAFNPETGALEVRGHVPTEGARPQLVGALQERVGATLPVQDALRLLPEPQCNVLTGLEGLGLPPSEEQFTDPALVGETGWAQDYAFSDGDRLTLDLEGPDYAAHVYLDYFDGAGNVVHIVPNEIVSLPDLGPAQPFSVGRNDGLDLRISAPFGQDIVVALATEEPLYDGLRPTVEPAEDYLEFLRARLDELGPMRGEWAYFFITTTAR